jgi:hypothetical protein
MNAGDTAGLRSNRSMVIESLLPIPACKIVAKIIVPSDHKVNLLADTSEEILRRIESESGLIAAIAAQRSATTP